MSVVFFFFSHYLLEKALDCNLENHDDDDDDDDNSNVDKLLPHSAEYFHVENYCQSAGKSLHLLCGDVKKSGSLE